MRTTLDINNEVLRFARKRAAHDGKTLTAVVEQALRQYLSPPSRKAGEFKLEIKSKAAGPVSGIDWGNRDDLFDRMDERNDRA